MKLPLVLVLSMFKRILAVLVNKDAREIGEEPSSEIIPPAPDQLAIPSIDELYSAGVKFFPTHGNLSTIRFDDKTATLYVPQVKLDNNTKVILRNLVAFEASAAPGSLVFRQYTDFMNGMIDGIEDVKLLRERGIICNHLQSDGDVASLWNSIWKTRTIKNATIPSDPPHKS